MTQYVDKAAVMAEIEFILNETNYKPFTYEVLGERKVCRDIKDFLNTLDVKEIKEEAVSNDLEDYAKKESESFAEREYEIDYIDRNALAKGYYWGVKDGAQWQKEQKPAWSEEDEETMSCLLSSLLINTSDQWAKYGNWLKSIKQRIGG